MDMVIEQVELQTDLRKPYEKPQIIHELELETRAGSPRPGILPDLLDEELNK